MENISEVKTAETTEAIAEDAKSDADLGDASEVSAEFTEGADDGGRPTESQGEGKSAQNAENAKRRRERERARELEAVKVQTIIDAVGENPYTNEPIKDAADVEEYLTMREIAKNGGDPISDYASYHKNKARRESEAADKAQKEKEWFDADRAAFVDKFPEVDIEELIKNEQFAEYADGKVGVKPLSEIYEGYNRFLKKAQASADTKAAQALANSHASPGALSGSQTPDKDFFTAEQVRAMSREEVKKNYEKIKESMARW